jgi:hypothetical protein
MRFLSIGDLRLLEFVARAVSGELRTSSSLARRGIPLIADDKGHHDRFVIRVRMAPWAHPRVNDLHIWRDNEIVDEVFGERVLVADVGLKALQS